MWLLRLLDRRRAGGSGQAVLPVPRAATGRPTPRSINLVRAAVVVRPRRARGLQVLRLLRRQRRRRARPLGLGLDPPVLEIALPVGISFFTFHAISYVIDIGRGQLEPLRLDEHGALPVVLPPPRRRDRSCGPARSPRSCARRPTPGGSPSGEAFRLIAFGLFKKVVVSSYVATAIVDPVFGAPAAHGPLDLLRGRLRVRHPDLRRLLRATPTSRSAARCCSASASPRTSTRPYRALSLQDFWRRWHMTLSRWLRDYLYIPLGGSRGRRAPHLPQPVPDDGDRRAVARRRHDLRRVGRDPRRLPGGRARGEGSGGTSECPSPVLPAPGDRGRSSGCSRSTWCAWRGSSSAPTRSATAFEVIGGHRRRARSPTSSSRRCSCSTIGLMLASQFVPADRRRARPGPLRAPSAPASRSLGLVGALTVIDVLGPDGVAPFIYFQF